MVWWKVLNFPLHDSLCHPEWNAQDASSWRLRRILCGFVREFVSWYVTVAGDPLDVNLLTPGDRYIYPKYEFNL